MKAYDNDIEEILRLAKEVYDLQMITHGKIDTNNARMNGVVGKLRELREITALIKKDR